MCEGLSKETGTCNDFICGTISPYTYSLIRKELRSQYYNVQVKEGDKISFESPLNLMNRIKIESPNSEVHWIFKGKALNFNRKDKFGITDKFEVTVKNVTQSDNGEYVCVVTSNTNVRTPLRVVVIAVEPKDNRLIFQGAPFYLKCESTLPDIYIDLLTKWYLNGSLLSESDIATIDSPSILRIPQAFFNHSGEWICVLEQSDLGLRWTVIMHNTNVIEQPSFLENLYYPSTILFNGITPIYVCSVVTILAITITLIVAFGAMCYLLLKKGKKRRKSNGKIIKLIDFKSLDEPEVIELLNKVEDRKIRKSRINVFQRGEELVNLTEEDEVVPSDEIVK